MAGCAGPARMETPKPTSYLLDPASASLENVAMGYTARAHVPSKARLCPSKKGKPYIMFKPLRPEIERLTPPACPPALRLLTTCLGHSVCDARAFPSVGLVNP